MPPEPVEEPGAGTTRPYRAGSPSAGAGSRGACRAFGKAASGSPAAATPVAERLETAIARPAAAAMATYSHGFRTTRRSTAADRSGVPRGRRLPHLLAEGAALGGGLLDDARPAPLARAHGLDPRWQRWCARFWNPRRAGAAGSCARRVPDRGYRDRGRTLAPIAHGRACRVRGARIGRLRPADADRARAGGNGRNIALGDVLALEDGDHRHSYHSIDI